MLPLFKCREFVNKIIHDMDTFPYNFRVEMYSISTWNGVIEWHRKLIKRLKSIGQLDYNDIWWHDIDSSSGAHFSGITFLYTPKEEKLIGRLLNYSLSSYERAALRKAALKWIETNRI